MTDPHDRGDNTDDVDVEEKPRRRGRGLAIVIALFALGGFGGVLWYAYTQGQHGAEAVAPILKADDSPTKVRPDQPGGMNVPHQDKLVLNTMPGGTQTTGQGERLLAPPDTPLPRPAVPAGASIPMPAPAVPATTAPMPAAPVPAMPAPAASTPQPRPMPLPAPLAAGQPTASAPPPQVAAAPATPSGAAPASAGTQPPLVAPAAPPPVTPAGTSTAASAAAASPGPAPAPSARPSPASAPQPTAAPAVVAATAPSRAGEYRVQLVAVRSPEEAAREWDRLKKQLPELQPLALTVVRVDLGAEKGVFFRVQAGPLPSDAQARDFCEAMKSKKQGCLVVRP